MQKGKRKVGSRSSYKLTARKPVLLQREAHMHATACRCTQSPFIGSKEALGSGATPILYFRYNSLADILLVSADMEPC